MILDNNSIKSIGFQNARVPAPIYTIENELNDYKRFSDKGAGTLEFKKGAISKEQIEEIFKNGIEYIKLNKDDKEIILYEVDLLHNSGESDGEYVFIYMKSSEIFDKFTRVVL